MNKKLFWIIIPGVLVLVIGCIFALQHSGILAYLFDRGLDRIGGIRVELHVVTDDALDRELVSDAAVIEDELQMRKISCAASRKAGSNGIEISGIDSAKDRDFRSTCERIYKSKYSLQSTAAEGKITYLLTLSSDYVRQVRESTVRQASEIIRRRLDALGARQFVVRILNGNAGEISERLLVEIPGVSDPERVVSLLTNISKLELRFVKEISGGPFSSVESAVQANDGSVPKGFIALPYREEVGKVEYLLVRNAPVITGQHIRTARRATDKNGDPAVDFFLTKDGAEMFSRATEQHIGQRLAIVLDDKVVSAPVINSRIEGEGMIQGHFTVEQAEDLAILLRSGALPASIQVLKQTTVAPQKGK